MLNGALYRLTVIKIVGFGWNVLNWIYLFLSNKLKHDHKDGPKKLKFFDSRQLMGEVIIKWFYFYYFSFHQPYAPAMHKNPNQKMRCMHTFFLWSAGNKRFCVLKFSKIREKVFYNCWNGGEQNQKTNIFSNPTSLKLSFPSVMEFFYGNACFWATLMTIFCWRHFFNLYVFGGFT